MAVIKGWMRIQAAELKKYSKERKVKEGTGYF
jgi:hypothetical protein